MTQAIHSGLLKFLSGLEYMKSLLSYNFILFLMFVSFNFKIGWYDILGAINLSKKMKVSKKKVAMQLIHRKCLFYFIPNI